MTSSAVHAAPSYSLQVLGAAASYGDVLLGDAGQLAANIWAYDPDLLPTPFSRSVLFANGTAVDLTAPGGGNFAAVGVGRDGTVSGNTGALMAGHRPVIWQNGTSRFVDLPEGSVNAWAWSGNALGDMVGFATLASGERVSVLWGRDGSAQIFAQPEGYSGFSAYGISDSGVVVGESARGPDEDGDGRADDLRILIWSNGTFTDVAARVNELDPRRINAAGQIIGTGAADEDGDTTAGYRIEADGAVHVLSVLGAESSSVEDINDAGWMVGSAWSAGSSFAVLWRDSDVAVDLNALIDPASGLKLIEARAINEAGQIAALALDAEGATRVVLLTPVPEPEMWSMLMLGALLLVVRSRTRRRSREI